MSKHLRSSLLAHEIAAAVFRVAVLIRHERLQKELEAAAVELVKKVEPKAADSLERLVRLAEAVKEMSEINAKVLCRELDNLQNMLHAEIAESISGVLESVDLRQVFPEKARKNGGGAIEKVWNQSERERAILEYIRQFPHGCRMRQLSAEFSGFSERTVRGDVGRLINKELVLKMGSKTGPYSYFKAVDSSDLQPKAVDLPPASSRVTKEEPFSL